MGFEKGRIGFQLGRGARLVRAHSRRSSSGGEKKKAHIKGGPGKERLTEDEAVEM